MAASGSASGHTLNLPRALIWGLGIVVILLAVGTYFNPTPSEPFIARSIHDYEFAVYDEEDNLLWSKTFQTSFNAMSWGEGFPWVLKDIDEDGSVEVLFAHNSTAPQPGPDDGLYCYSAAGNLLWRFTPGRSISIDGFDYDDAFKVRDFATGTDGRGKTFVVVAGTHRPYAPTQITILAAESNPIGEYWNYGYVLDLLTADFDGDGVDEIVLGGVNNAISDPVTAREHRVRQQGFIALIEHDINSATGPGPTVVPAGLRR